ncbi:hypothetical protein [Pseudomonas koreensis]|uniref:hypothetical protein n=1 Tax=Pseudomonas koreensis TaxID=198620 RepID=UPI0014731B5F|nr:hypothetical protein [Pseudomonas koreensis]NNA59427.1 hypothetical protein [Pseudomonas koreensis]
MNITISSIIKSTANEILVEYSTPYGKGFSVFIGSPPKENQIYDVEINIDDNFIWGENLTPSKKNIPSISFDICHTYITAELIVTEEDGCGVLKMGESIILISLEQTKQRLPIFVDIIAKKTFLHPTNI